MLRSGDWVTPRLDGVRYFEKPPLLYWTGAASMGLFGENADAARLPTRLLTLLAALACAWGAAGLAGRRAGLLAAALYLGALFPGLVGRAVSIDAVLSFGTALAFAGLARGVAALRARPGEAIPRPLAWATGAGLGLGLLAKGPIAAVLAGAAAGIWWLLDSRRLREVWRLRPLLTTAIALAIATPWFVIVSLRNPRFPQFFFIHEHFQRFATDEARRHMTPGALAGMTLLSILPWTPVALAAAWAAVRRGDGPARLLAGAALFPPLFFSLSHSQLPGYILPSAAPFAILAALRLARDEGGPWTARCAAACAAAIGAILLAAGLAGGRWIALPAGSAAPLAAAGALWVAGGLFAAFAGARAALAPRLALAALALVPALAPAAARALAPRSRMAWAREVAATLAPGDRPVFVGNYLRALPLVLRRPVAVCGWRDELDHGLSYADAAEIAWDDARLAREWAGGAGVVAIVLDRPEPRAAFAARGLQPLFAGPKIGDRILFANRPWGPPAPGAPAPPAR